MDLQEINSIQDFYRSIREEIYLCSRGVRPLAIHSIAVSRKDTAIDIIENLKLATYDQSNLGEETCLYLYFDRYVESHKMYLYTVIIYTNNEIGINRLNKMLDMLNKEKPTLEDKKEIGRLLGYSEIAVQKFEKNFKRLEKERSKPISC